MQKSRLVSAAWTHCPNTLEPRSRSLGTQGLGEGVSEQKAFVKTAPVVFRRLAALVATACFTKQKVKGLDLKGKVRALGSEHMHGNKSGAKMEGHAVVPASYVSLHSFHLVCFHFI